MFYQYLINWHNDNDDQLTYIVVGIIHLHAIGTLIMDVYLWTQARKLRPNDLFFVNCARSLWEKGIT